MSPDSSGLSFTYESIKKSLNLKNAEITAVKQLKNNMFVALSSPNLLIFEITPKGLIQLMENFKFTKFLQASQSSPLPETNQLVNQELFVLNFQSQSPEGIIVMIYDYQRYLCVGLDFSIYVHTRNSNSIQVNQFVSKCIVDLITGMGIPSLQGLVRLRKNVSSVDSRGLFAISMLDTSPENLASPNPSAYPWAVTSESEDMNCSTFLALDGEINCFAYVTLQNIKPVQNSSKMALGVYKSQEMHLFSWNRMSPSGQRSRILKRVGNNKVSALNNSFGNSNLRGDCLAYYVHRVNKYGCPFFEVVNYISGKLLYRITLKDFSMHWAGLEISSAIFSEVYKEKLSGMRDIKEIEDREKALMTNLLSNARFWVSLPSFDFNRLTGTSLKREQNTFEVYRNTVKEIECLSVFEQWENPEKCEKTKEHQVFLIVNEKRGVVPVVMQKTECHPRVI